MIDRDGTDKPVLDDEDEAWVQEQVQKFKNGIEEEGGELPESRLPGITQSFRNSCLAKKTRQVEASQQAADFESVQATPQHVIAPAPGRPTEISEERSACSLPVNPAGETGYGNWFPCPHDFFRDKGLDRIAPGARLFYLFLLSWENRYAGREKRGWFWCQDCDAAAILEVSTRTIRNWRNQLMARELVECEEKFTRAKGWECARKVTFYRLLGPRSRPKPWRPWSPN